MTLKLERIRQVVLDELKHIPKGNYVQNELRMVYFSRRMHSLGRKAKEQKIAKEVLMESIAFVKKRHPEFKPTYDKEFFKIEPKEKNHS